MPARIYIVVPKTIDSHLPPFKLSMSCGRMAAHAAHAAGLLQHTYPSSVSVSDTDLITLSVANSKELGDVLASLESSSAGGDIRYVKYFDTDKSFDGDLLTAVAAMVYAEESRKVFKGLRPWKCRCNEV